MSEYKKLVEESFFRIPVGVPFDGFRPAEGEFLDGVANGDLVVMQRADLERLLRTAADFDGEAAHLGGGGSRPGGTDWKFLARIQRMLGIENEERKGYSFLAYRNSVAEQLEAVNHIVAVGSVDGILTTAAVLNIIGEGAEVSVEFTQAFQVNSIDPTSWQSNRNVAFVDLAVNNRDKAMTADFVRRVRETGHSIVAVIDEHDAADWLEALGSFEGLIVEPMSQKTDKVGSAAEVLVKALGYSDYYHLGHLLSDAAAGDRMEFRRFGETVNKAIKVAISDNERRVYLARHFAFNAEPDTTIQSWIAEYDSTLGAANAEVIEAKVDLGDEIVRVITTGKTVDMTVLMKTLYDDGARVVILEGEQWSGPEKGKILMVSFGTGEEDLDLMSAIRTAGVTPYGGFANKVNCDLSDEAIATTAVRELLSPFTKRDELYFDHGDPHFRDAEDDN